jgi:hypothetical protein
MQAVGGFSRGPRRHATVVSDMPENAPRRSWFGRNWRWVLSGWLGLGLSGGVGALAILNTARATKMAIAAAEANPALIARVGEPMKTGWLVLGSIEVTEASGRADLAIPISGPQGRGTLYPAAVKKAGLWMLVDLQFGAEGDSGRIQLLAKYLAAPCGEVGTRSPPQAATMYSAIVLASGMGSPSSRIPAT